MEELKWSAQNGDIDKLNAILASVDVNSACGSSKRTALHIAADYGQKQVIEILLDKGAEIDKEDDNKITPLLNAIFEGHTSCVALLLQKGADKNGKAPSGESYIEVAEKDEIKKLLK